MSENFDFSKNPGKEIGDYLQKRGLKQIHLARVTGISAPRVCTICSGRARIMVDEYARICAALGVPMSKFVERYDSQPPAE